MAPPTSAATARAPAAPGSSSSSSGSSGSSASPASSHLGVRPNRAEDRSSLFDDTSAVCDRVFSFLGLESFDVEPSKVYNRGFYQEKIDPRVAERLRDHYAPYDELLTEIVGRPFGWTRKALAA